MNTSQIYDEYVQKLADAVHIPYPYILAIRDKGLFSNKAIRNLLIKNDYFRLLKRGKMTEKQIVEKLSGVYDVSKQTIPYIIKENVRRWCYCVKCGKKLNRVTYIRNDGICDKCVSNQNI